MEVFGLPRMKGPRLTVWRSSFAHPRSTHIQTVHTHWLNYKAEVVCPTVVPHAADRASQEKRTLTEINAAFAPGRNAGSAQPRYWDSQHSATAPDDGDDPFFYLLRCQLVDLLHPNFIARYMKTGLFTAISVGTGIDRHNVVAIVPLGGEGKATLVLSVDKETYEQLGLEGKKSVFKTTNRYNIHIDLCAPNFVPGKKFFERVRWCLSGRLSDVELLASWSVGGKTKKMEFARAVKSKPLAFKEASRLLKDLNVPIIDEDLLAGLFATGAAAEARTADKLKPKPKSAKGKEKAKEKMVDSDVMQIKVEVDDDDDDDSSDDDDGSKRKEMDKIEKVMKKMQLQGPKGKKNKPSQTSDEARAFLHDMFEYLGYFAINASWGLTSSLTREQAHSFLSLDRFHISAKVMHYQWSGLISCAFIDDLLTKARKLVANKTVPWAAVMVTGFEDAPLSWGKNEHGAGDVPPGGENDYTFVVLPNDQYWLFVATGKNDTYSA